MKRFDFKKFIDNPSVLILGGDTFNRNRLLVDLLYYYKNVPTPYKLFCIRDNVKSIIKDQQDIIKKGNRDFECNVNNDVNIVIEDIDSINFSENDFLLQKVAFFRRYNINFFATSKTHEIHPQLRSNFDYFFILDNSFDIFNMYLSSFPKFTYEIFKNILKSVNCIVLVTNCTTLKKSVFWYKNNNIDPIR
jgi:hypothetical protein